MGGRKQWVKQQAQRYQDYVHAVEMLEVLAVAMMEKKDMVYYAQHAIELIYMTRKTIVKDVVL